MGEKGGKSGIRLGELGGAGVRVILGSGNLSPRDTG